jgi:hypothetical protein
MVDVKDIVRELCREVQPLPKAVDDEVQERLLKEIDEKER